MFGKTPQEFDQKMKSLLTDEAYRVWRHNMDNEDKLSVLAQPLRNPPIDKEARLKAAINAARDAVSGYSTSNGARKAVEALADAVEQIS